MLNDVVLQRFTDLYEKFCSLSKEIISWVSAITQATR